MLRLIRASGFDGIAHAVNPKHRMIDGYPCVPSVEDLPTPPDLAVIAVRNERLEETMRQVMAVGAGAAVIFASGTLPDDTNPPLLTRLKAIAGDVPVCGPNGMGFYNDLDHVWIGAFASQRKPEPGAIALIAHSGSVFGALAHNDPRLRFALAISPGQELTATVADYVQYALRRPEVRVIGLFLETARDPAGLRKALEDAAARGTPVVALKVGRTPAAAAAALTHTGAMAGSAAAWAALFDRTGTMAVETLDELAATMLLCATGRRPGAGGLAAIHDSGGERELTIDLADRIRVPFAQVGEATLAAIQARLDPGLEAANPLDAWGTGKDYVPLFTDCFTDLLADRRRRLVSSVSIFVMDTICTKGMRKRCWPRLRPPTSRLLVLPPIPRSATTGWRRLSPRQACPSWTGPRTHWWRRAACSPGATRGNARPTHRQSFPRRQRRIAYPG
jgi:acyl-CoA synthetase (NDP forming)